MKTEDKLTLLKRAIEQYPGASIRKLVEYTGLSKSVIGRLMMQL
ncbi:hypothetical protein [Bacillus mycoides]|nr:hypothetical protein [Bacillus mycoides]MCQ6531309.1 hypothetical protein [Bacillus mycoides]